MTGLDGQAEEWRSALCETVVRDAVLPLCLSGGMDSTTLLAAAQEVGARPVCYSFSIGGAESRDLHAARRVARLAGAELRVVDIPRTEDQLLGDVRAVIGFLGRSRKTAVQCAHPVWRMAQAAGADGFPGLVLGTGGICEDNRAVQVAAGAGDWETVDRIRRANIGASGQRGTATWAMHEAVRAAGLRPVEPYAALPVRAVGLAVPFPEINSPRQKGIALRAFPGFYRRVGWRQNASLQIGSGLREWHDTLLASPANRRGSRAVVGVYNDVAREVLT